MNFLTNKYEDIKTPNKNDTTILVFVLFTKIIPDIADINAIKILQSVFVDPSKFNLNNFLDVKKPKLVIKNAIVIVIKNPNQAIILFLFFDLLIFVFY